jgi:hypothetical protein
MMALRSPNPDQRQLRSRARWRRTMPVDDRLLDEKGRETTSNKKGDVQ